MNRGCGTARIAALSSAMIQIPSQGSGERRQAGAGAGEQEMIRENVLTRSNAVTSHTLTRHTASQVTLLHVTLRHKSH